MEDLGAEPEQKRIKRIAEHIEDEIVRAQHLPLEELIRHKAFMVRLLQFLSIEEAYAVSLTSRRIYEWFQNNDIWYILAQRWLTPERLAQCEAWVEQVKPRGKRINYLWLLLGEAVMTKWQQHKNGLLFRLVDDRGDWITFSHTTNQRWRGADLIDVHSWSSFGGSPDKFTDTICWLTSGRDWGAAPADWGYFRERRIKLNPAQAVYLIMSRQRDIRLSFHVWRNYGFIRSKLGN